MTSTGRQLHQNGYWCEICKVSCVNAEIFSKHNAGTRHSKKVAEQMILLKLFQEDCFELDSESGVLRCVICNIIGTPVTLEEHFNSSKHKSRVESKELLQKLKEITDCVESGTVDHDKVIKCAKCKICNFDVSLTDFEAHLRGARHNNALLGREIPIKRKHVGEGVDPYHTPVNVTNPEEAERTVFLKNIRSRNEEKIRAVFEDCGEIESFYFIRNLFGKYKESGYLTFKNKMAVVKALEKDKSLIEEHPLQVLAAEAYTPKDKLFVSGLPATMTEEEIRTIFEPHGEIKDLWMIRKRNKKFKGTCYLYYENEDTAAAVKKATDQFEVALNHKISVQFSYPPRPLKGQRETNNQVSSDTGLQVNSHYEEGGASQCIDEVTEENEDEEWFTDKNFDFDIDFLFTDHEDDSDTDSDVKRNKHIKR